MQLGARWRVGDPPHRGVPEALHGTIAEQEAQHPTAGAWTLTWLEGRPVCELDDVAFVTLDVVGRVRTGPLREGDGAASAHAAPSVPYDRAAAPAAGGPAGADGDSDDDDDDDWLK